MKNTLIFLHGKGVSSRRPEYEIFKEIAAKENADMFIIDAKFPHSTGFPRWNNYHREPNEANYQEFLASLEHIETETEKIMAERGIKWGDIIWLGHSQGGSMAIITAIKHGAKKVIGMMPALWDDRVGMGAVRGISDPHLDFPIYWVAAEFEEAIPKEHWDDWKLLQAFGADVRYMLSKGSRHNFYAPTIFDYDCDRPVDNL